MHIANLRQAMIRNPLASLEWVLLLAAVTWGQPTHLALTIGAVIALCGIGLRIEAEAKDPAKISGVFDPRGSYRFMRYPIVTSYALSALGICIAARLHWAAGLYLPILLVIYRRILLTVEAQRQLMWGSEYERYAFFVAGFYPNLLPYSVARISSPGAKTRNALLRGLRTHYIAVLGFTLAWILMYIKSL